MVREDAWYDFNFLKFTEVWFVTQDVICPGECSIALEKMVCSAFVWNVLKISMRPILSNVSFKTSVSLLIFCFHDLSIGVSGVLRSPIIVLLLISCFILISICLTYYGAPMLGAYIFIIFISSWIDPLIIIQCLSLSLITLFISSLF